MTVNCPGIDLSMNDRKPVIASIRMNRELIDSIRCKRLIFTVTTGRSGTAYLSAILGYVRNVHSYHEPEPEYRSVLRQCQTDPDLARRFLVDEKFPAILRDRAGIYVETSHLVCKGFLEPLLDLGIVPDLIIHRRPPREGSISLYTMGTIPGRSAKALQFYLSPGDPNVLPLHGWEKLHDYQLCYWYCIEMERRAQEYKQLFLDRGANVAETTLTGLKTLDGFEQLLTALGLCLKIPAWLTRKRFLRKTGVKVNESKETKKDNPLPENIDALEADVVARIDRNALKLNE